MLLRCMFMMLGRVQSMPVGDLGMVGGLFVVSGPVMFSSFAMMLCGMLMMFRRLFVMLMDVVRAHCSLPAFRLVRF